ncbi:GntR family transcriptional regulator [Rhodoplanes roseus]|uniref:GntR family transcriptional regulator n=1 Tax=Rhodoplanes roseus TaxID=29409 RepID=UPI0014750B4D|nr:GntR family transcriptional regulator [Rhodoplanes roseus]
MQRRSAPGASSKASSKPASKSPSKPAASEAMPAAAALNAMPRPEAEPPPPSRSAWLAQVLRERIITGGYRPGERIREAQLREEFGFSNGPIREALQAVVADGLAERPPFQGVRVKLLSKREIVELFQVRLAILEYAVELAARAATPATAKSAAEIKRSIDEGFSRIESGHPAFGGQLSQWLLAATGNRIMCEIWDRTLQQTLIYVNASFVRSRGRKSKAMVHALIDHIAAGDVAEARTSARALTVQTLADLGISAVL